MNTNYNKRMQTIQESIAVIGNRFEVIPEVSKPQIQVISYIDNSKELLADVKSKIEMLYTDDINTDYSNGFNDAIARVLSIIDCNIKE